MLSFKHFVEEDTYHGEHSAPDPESGAPMHNLDGIFPSDIYSSTGLKHYGHETGSSDAYSSIMRTRNKPERFVTVFRAVPHIKSNEEHIADYQQHQQHILKHGKVPASVNTKLNSSQYYEHAGREIERLKAAPKVNVPKMGCP